jgi:pyruvate/2-oxoglutarate dehydrogenase complex dihydrolipoamide acyltransferase (E2) component
VSTEQRYSEALAEAIVSSLRADPPPGLPARVVIRWFDGPGYLTIHALGTEEEAELPGEDAWNPLEWPNSSREIGRADGILEEQSVAAAAAALAADLEEGAWPWTSQPEPLILAASKVRDRLQETGIDVPDHFAVGVTHFEGWGAEDSVPRSNPEAVLRVLSARGLEPGE